MSRERRVDLIRALEAARGSRVIAYVTGDRGQAFQARMAEDAVLPVYRHLLAGGDGSRQQRLDLFLYTRGGDVSCPWRLATMIREFCSDFALVIPYKAHSAGTMLALGADALVMGRKAELSPIDPSLVRAASEGVAQPAEISVEDVTSYVSFMQETAGISDQMALAQVMTKLADDLTPLVVGSVQRQHSHIRLVARKLLASRQARLEEQRLNAIVEALTEKMYSHGHAIGRDEAQELGLPVERPDSDTEDLVWSLYEQYEEMLQLSVPCDPQQILMESGEEQVSLDGVPLAAIESVERLDAFEVNAEFRWTRRTPANPQINLNFQLGLPPGVDPASLGAEGQRVLQELISNVGQVLPGMVQQEINRQSPVSGVEARTFGGRWVRKPAGGGEAVDGL